MIELDPKALSAAIDAYWEADEPHGVSDAITAYLSTRHEQGWVEIEIGNGEPDWTMADHFAASLDRGVAAAVEEEREACALVLDRYRHEIHEAEDWPGQAIHEENVLESAASLIRSRSSTQQGQK